MNGWKATAVSVFLALVLFIIGAVAVRVWYNSQKITVLETQHNYDERLDRLEGFHGIGR